MLFQEVNNLVGSRRSLVAEIGLGAGAVFWLMASFAGFVVRLLTHFAGSVNGQDDQDDDEDEEPRAHGQAEPEIEASKKLSC